MVSGAKGIFGPTPLAIGVDLCGRIIFIVTLRVSRNGLMLEDFFMHPVKGKLLQEEGSLSEEIEATTKKIPAHAHMIGTSLSWFSVLVKAITLPEMSENDLRDHLSLELDRYISFETQDVVWDVCRRGSLSEHATDQQEHFLVVAKKECVEQQMEAFNRNKRALHFVDVDIFSLINLVTYNYGTEDTWLLAHIESTGIVMALIRHGAPVDIRQETYGAEWYEDLLDQISLEPSLALGNELGPSAALLLEQFFQETSQKVSRILESLSDHSTKGMDRGILLSGRYAVAPGMAQSLALSLGMPVHLIDPFEAITVPPSIQENPVFQQIAPLMSVAVAVALRGALCHD